MMFLFYNTLLAAIYLYMVSDKLSQTYKQYHCLIIPFLFNMKTDTISIIISGITELPL